MIHTTLTSWALVIWRELELQGVDPKPIFDSLALDTSLLRDGNARYEVPKMQQLWQRAVEATDNPAFGVDAGKHWSPTTFHALGYAWLASASLADGLKRVVRYSQLVNDGVMAAVQRSGGFYELQIGSINAPQTIPAKAGLDAATVAMVKMCRMLAGEVFAPYKVTVYHEPSPSNIPMEAYVRCPVEQIFHPVDSRRYITIVFEAISAERKLGTGNAALMSANETLLKDYLGKLGQASMVNQVMGKLTELLPSGHFDEQDVAEHLNISPRTLQRKLAAEGVSYNGLLNQVRQDMAEVHMQNSMLSLTEIAYLLGFSEQSNFTRAFRRWHDVPPSEYRKALAQ